MTPAEQRDEHWAGIDRAGKWLLRAVVLFGTPILFGGLGAVFLNSDSDKPTPWDRFVFGTKVGVLNVIFSA